MDPVVGPARYPLKAFQQQRGCQCSKQFLPLDSQACISIIGNCYIVIHPTACMFAIIRQQMALRFHMLSSEFLALLLYKSWSAADGFVDSFSEIMYYPYPMRNCYSQIIPLIHSWKVKKMAPTNDGLLKIFPFELPIWSWSTDQTFDVDEEANFVSDADTCSPLFFAVICHWWHVVLKGFLWRAEQRYAQSSECVKVYLSQVKVHIPHTYIWAL